MAEGKHSGSKNFGKVLQKTVFRTKEKVLQNLGKADKTQDDEFDIHVNNFSKQQSSAVKLQKELKNYLTCVKAMSAANKVFYETLRDIYEDSWTGHSDMTGAVEALTAMWEDYLLKLTGQVQEPLAIYVNRFPDLKHKISKRNRKLMDFDSTRHTRDSLTNQKKKDETKINKAHDEMNAAKKIYNEINTELHEDLPNFHESRKSVLSSALNSLFSAEAKFQEESAKIKNTLSDATARLNQESSDVYFKQYNHSPMLSGGSSSSQSQTSPQFRAHIPSDRASNHSNHSSRYSHRDSHDNSKTNIMEDSKAVIDLSRVELEERGSTSSSTKLDIEKPTINGHIDINTSPGPSSPVIKVESNDAMYENIMLQSSLTQNTLVDDTEEEVPSPKSSPDVRQKEPVIVVDNNNIIVTKPDSEARPEPEYSLASTTDDSEEIYKVPTSKISVQDEEEEIYKVPTSNEPVEPQPDKDGILYKVLATHPYAGEDIDELTFETGDLINVMAYDDPEEQDDGWLMGVKVSGGAKGVFPENFTKRV